LEDELLTAFGRDLDIELVRGSGGVYEIVVDGETVFSKKKEGRFPDSGEIVALMRR